MLVGPIDYWWSENWETPEHLEYARWRDDIGRRLVEAGHLVYRPHEAFKGAWDERAQWVNDAAILQSDLLINLNPGVPAYGTDAEIAVARSLRKPVLWAPPGKDAEIAHLLQPLDDPYGAVHRKSYTRELLKSE